MGMKKRRFGAEGEDEGLVIMGKKRSGVNHCPRMDKERGDVLHYFHDTHATMIKKTNIILF